ncbi:MAG: DUF4760 domain-containing protein [Planctomycetota bacterium]|nr:DUF4760 domain-containing protein [Planctomycetota bacterium]
MADPNTVFQAFMAAGAIGTAIGSFAIYKAILENNEEARAGNEWNRRQTTITMIKEWNDQARSHIKFLREKYSDLSDFDWKASDEVLKKKLFHKDEAKKVLLGESEESREIRDRLFTLFNYFEYVATAYEKEVVDKQAIEVSFKGVILNTYTYFNAFVQIMREERKYEPWLPLALLVSKWTTIEQQSGSIQ